MTTIEIARWAAAAVYALLLLAAAWFDYKHRRIPNWIVAALLALFVPWVFIGSEVSLLGAAAAFAIALAIGFVLYLLKVVGAGDSKLFAVLALFAGLKQLALLALATVLVGGLVALGYMVFNPKSVMRGMTKAGREKSRGIPYGLPIAAAGLIVMFTPPLGAVYDHGIGAAMRNSGIIAPKAK